MGWITSNGCSNIAEFVVLWVLGSIAVVVAAVKSSSIGPQWWFVTKSVCCKGMDSISSESTISWACWHVGNAQGFVRVACVGLILCEVVKTSLAVKLTTGYDWPWKRTTFYHTGWLNWKSVEFWEFVVGSTSLSVPGVSVWERIAAAETDR